MAASSSITLPDSRKIVYSLDSEPKDAPLVLLSNSLGSPFTSWDHVVKALHKSGFRTLRYNQPGHGGTSPPSPLSSLTFTSMADDVASLLKELGIKTLHAWVGVSMGAAAGFYFVTRNPGVVRKFVPCDTIACSPVNAGVEDLFGPRVEKARQDGNMEGMTQSTMERWFGKPWMDAHAEETARMRSLMHGTTVDGFEACCHALRSETFDLRPLFGKVGASVEEALCVVGEKDANLPQVMEGMRGEMEEGFKAAGKNVKVELKIIKNAGHVCFIDGYDQFMEVVTPFLTAKSPSTSGNL